MLSDSNSMPWRPRNALAASHADQAGRQKRATRLMRPPLERDRMLVCCIRFLLPPPGNAAAGTTASEEVHMSERADEAGGDAAQATVPCPNCGAGVPLADGEAAGDVTCPSCGTRVPIEKTPTRGVSPS
jgi:endogenous inhibitor of DNA gyrase (YacG/DUF329 family)